MIQVRQLTKHYGSHKALDELSFSVNRGEVVGFLGPNGAGKSTLMRILSGFSAASSGSVHLAGFDVVTHTREIWKRIGYMPENNPLPADMRVEDYLSFRGKLKGLSSKKLKHRKEVVIQQCGLSDVKQRFIDHLSRGYKQRVGLADALIHEPDLLILDEPTVGLDPEQIRSVRRLIRELGGKHTLMISSHLLSEIEVTCNRILILHQGRILASDHPDNLGRQIQGSSKFIAEISATAEELNASLSQWEEVKEMELENADGPFTRCLLTVDSEADIRERIYQTAVANSWALRELRRVSFSLEDIFIHLTNKDSFRNGKEPKEQ
ncbi:MAG TPA: ABC transporter ATP-binding protein [Verrucomicrobiales bacterium]|jgi:ABC-2 type transport system ATP-binding protein|nr:ABC transporter ATP-binding protein [Verrucomicrobiales bacterium]